VPWRLGATFTATAHCYSVVSNQHHRIPLPYCLLISSSHNLKRSMLTCSSPQFPMKFNQTMISDIAVPPPSSDSIFCSCSTYLRDLFGMELCRILQDLYHFTRFINYYISGSRSFGPTESTLFEVWNASIEYRLLSYSNSNHGMSMCDYILKEALRTAAILWIGTGLWNFLFSASIIVSPVGHPVEILKQSDLNSWREGSWRYFYGYWWWEAAAI
jgi:hypothetical protein